MDTRASREEMAEEGGPAFNSSSGPTERDGRPRGFPIRHNLGKIQGRGEAEIGGRHV
jgi:hypothetical protein